MSHHAPRTARTTSSTAARRPRVPLLVSAAAAASAVLALLGSAVTTTPAAASHEDDRSSGGSVSVDPGTGYGHNPLAAGRWGVYTGSADGVYPAWQVATGDRKDLLAKAALRPRVRWLGHWIPGGSIAGAVRDYIRTTQGGDPSVLVPMALFRLWPETEARRNVALTQQQRTDYRRWIDGVVAGIGSSRVAVVLEPDLALLAPPMRSVAMPTADPAARTALVRYAARKLGALRRTSVYLDSGDADWLTIEKSVNLLKAAGVVHARGFALGATHYSSVADNIAYGTRLKAALRAAGLPGKHFVIDTADNGRPFTWGQYAAAHPRGDYDNAEACRTRSETRCVTLGIPPTVDVAAARWGLPSSARAAARRHVDGYLWFGRPWLYRQASPFLLDRTLTVARTTPY